MASFPQNSRRTSLTSASSANVPMIASVSNSLIAANSSATTPSRAMVFLLITIPPVSLFSVADAVRTLLSRVGPLGSRARPAALVIHELHRHPERRLRHREDEADLTGVGLALQGDASARQFGLGVVEVVDFDSDVADDRSLAIP